MRTDTPAHGDAHMDGVREIEATWGRSFDALTQAAEARIRGS